MPVLRRPAPPASPGARRSGGGVALRGITKRYGTLAANDDVSVEFEPGQIHVVVGENGAGKSTLMGILAGTVAPDAGEIVVDGHPVVLHGARDATRHSIGMVYQHFQLVEVFTVAQNVALGFEHTRRFGGLDLEATREEVRRVSSEFGLPLDPDAVVANLPVGVQQRVEIVKILLQDPQVVIFDEPTAVLTGEEADGLLATLSRLRDDGRAVVFITHKLREALAVGDRITVLRRGRVVGTTTPDEVTPAELGAMMVGRELTAVGRDPGRVADDRPPVLSVRNVSYRSSSGFGARLRNIAFDIRPGEILGVVGVDGNGQDELAGVLTGALAPTGGAVHLGDRDTGGWSTAEFLRAGVGVVPADRHRQGLALPMTVARNLIIDRRKEPRFTRFAGLLIDDDAVGDYAEEMIAKYDIRTPGALAPVAALSGGNQQKVILARELERDIRLLVTSQPTRGLDVGSIEYVHRRLVEVATRGCAVVLVTSELDEALALSDRIAPLFGGAITSIEDRPFDRHRLGLLMGGG